MAERAVRPDLRLDPEAAERIRGEIGRAGGREVCFLAEVTPDRRIVHPRAVARGNHQAVLAASRDARAGEILLHNHPSGNLEPSEPDMILAARVYEAGLGTAITDNQAEGLYVLVEPPEPRERNLLDVDALDDILAPGGALSRTVAGYEDRPGQREMLRAVATRYNEGGVTVVEAGTGTGKSLAYLLPAAKWALENRERTVVSTNTINLQEQLVGKDLPLVRELVGRELTFALVKGRGNYVSIRRLLLAAESAPTLFEDDRSHELEGLREWIGTSRDGSLSDLAAPPSDEVWEEVRSDGDICLKARCPHFQACFYQQSRRRAAAADVLVANHALLFSDVQLRRTLENWTQSAVLPPYAHVVLDEGHNAEDAATSHLGAEVTRTGLFRTLSRLDRNGKGVLAAVEQILGALPPSGERDELVRRIRDRLRPAALEAREELGRFFDVLEPRVPGPDEEPLRLGRGDARDPTGDPTTLELLDRVVGALARVGREVEEIRLRVESDEALRDGLEARLLDLRSLERRLETARAGLRLVLDPRDESDRFVRWVEGRGRRGDALRNVVLAAAPVEPGHLLRESLFRQVETAVVTSATLTTGVLAGGATHPGGPTEGERGDFRFIRGRLGLAEDPTSPEIPLTDALPVRGGGFSDFLLEEGWAGAPEDGWGVDGAPGSVEPLPVTEIRVPSPFDYRAQTLLAVPTDLPGAGDGDAFHHATARVAGELAEMTGGGIFLLFTSYHALRTTAARLRGCGVDRRFPLLVHGEGPRSQLLSRFTDAGNGILLGTSSFWEGVDVPGDPLRGLILQKIPFRVPTEPITQARTEAIERRGGNGFMGYQVPLAALRLRQGFGRLIRSRTDRGAVLLLDRRILRARYGARLLAGLPEAPLLKGPWDEVMVGLGRFYGTDARVRLPRTGTPVD
jgi:ATP-dependent DNA helicase DinG